MVMATTQKGEDEGGERSISVLVLFLEVTGVRWLRQNQGYAHDRIRTTA